MLGLIAENSWKLNEIEREETLTALATIVPDAVLSGLFDLYTNKVESNSEGANSSKKPPVRYQYKEEMVCRMIAQNILQQGLKFHVADFITTWQEALPEGMQINVSYLPNQLFRMEIHIFYFYFPGKLPSWNWNHRSRVKCSLRSFADRNESIRKSAGKNEGTVRRKGQVDTESN